MHTGDIAMSNRERANDEFAECVLEAKAVFRECCREAFKKPTKGEAIDALRECKKQYKLHVEDCEDLKE
jgi:hypothetical protein